MDFIRIGNIDGSKREENIFQNFLVLPELAIITAGIDRNRHKKIPKIVFRYFELSVSDGNRVTIAVFLGHVEEIRRKPWTGKSRSESVGRPHKLKRILTKYDRFLLILRKFEPSESRILEGFRIIDDLSEPENNFLIIGHDLTP